MKISQQKPGPEFFANAQQSLRECQENFEYKTRNPYRERLQDYPDVMLQDLEGEKHQGNWKAEVFKNQKELHLEIGTGYGHFLEQFCQENPDVNMIGMDYRFKRSFQLTKKLAKKDLENFRLLRAKGERIDFLFDKNELDQAYFFFPDPWPKNRHLKKRLFQLPFLTKMHKILKPGGLFYVKTDHDDYAFWMEEVLKNNEYFSVEFVSHDLHKESEPALLLNYKTKFEKIFMEKNKNVHGFVLRNKMD